MGGGGGKAPEPKKFVAPPIDNSPATNPIPNFFTQGGPQRPNPFAGLGQGAQPQSPFGQQQGQMTPDMILALLRQLRGGQ